MSEKAEKYEESSEKNGEFDLPQRILEKYDSDQQVQLIRGYRILQVLKYYPNNEPFFEKPENFVRGTKRYYDVIQSPMYLNEIKRKFFNAEYNSLFEVIKDMRLIFENCYYFWGPKSSMIDQCLHMERMMEGQLLLLPKDLKSGCTLEETHGRNEDDVVTKVWTRCRNKGKACSRLMLRTWRKRRVYETKEYSSKSDLSKVCKNSKQIMRWERDVLFLPDILSFISSALELPLIGLFFQLVQKEYDLAPISQTEVERMVIMPQYSSSFREILSALLSENHSKDSLQYDEVTEKIKHYVTEWYDLFSQHHEDEIEVSNVTGIQTNFFEIVGTENPLKNVKYECLPYCQKVIILKSICDHLVHTQSNLEELVSNADESVFCARKIGRDKYGFTYLFFPSFWDFRLYKQKIKEDSNSTKDNSSDELYATDVPRMSLKRFLPSTSKNFEIVADSTEGLRCLIDELFYTDVENSKKDSKTSNAEIIEALQELEWDPNSREPEYIRWTSETRIKLFSEWKESSENEPIMDDETEYNNMKRDLLNEQMSSNESCRSEPSHFVDGTNHSEDDGDVDADSECGRENDAEDEELSKQVVDVAKKGPNETVFADSLNESFGEEIRSSVKNEPTEIEENFSDYEIKNEVKEEIHSDSQSESSVSTRRRRSSVPSYSVYNDDFFSDDNDFDSPEDSYSSTEDSDDEWEIPSKRARNKNKMKATRSSSKNDSLPPVVERPRRKCRINPGNVSVTPQSEDDAEPTSTTVAELTIKEEVKSEPIEGGGGENTSADDLNRACNEEEAAAKPIASKIKVIDLARLRSGDGSSNVLSLRKTPPDAANAYLIQTTSSSAHSLPVLRACISQNAHAYSRGHVLQQPRMALHPTMSNHHAYNVMPRHAQNALLVTSMRRSAPLQNVLMPMQRPPQTIIRTLGPDSFLNTVPANRQQNAMRRSNGGAHPFGKQMVRVPMHNVNRSVISGGGDFLMRKQTLTFDRSYRSAAPSVSHKIVNSGVGAAMKSTTKPMMMVQRRPAVREIEGTIGIHSNGGHLQFVVNLANGSHVPLSNEQVQKLRDGNRGVLPQKLKIPVPADVAEKIEPCVVLDE